MFFIFVGALLFKMIEDMKSRINGSLDENLKMFMYSGVNTKYVAKLQLPYRLTILM